MDDDEVSEWDPLYEGDDPWSSGPSQAPRPNNQSQGSSPATSQRPAGGRIGTYAVGLSQQEPPPQRIIHDIPPTWDGTKPETDLEPFLKLLRGWLTTTRTQKTQAGMTILHYAHGDLKLVINELDIEDLTAEDSGERVFKHVQRSYEEYVDRKLPKALERALFDTQDSQRRKGESMIQYCVRKSTLFKELDRAKCVLPDNAKAYILLRDAKLNDKARDTIETWTKGEYQYLDMQKQLKKLERPVPGTNSSHIVGLTGIVDVEPPRIPGGAMPAVPEAEVVDFIPESLYLDPNDLEEEDVHTILGEVHNPDILFVTSDMPNDVILSEDESVAILANYGQVRQFLHKKSLGRGFTNPKTPSTGANHKKPNFRPGPRRTAPPKKWTKSHLMSRTKCARCGKTGHWARECTNEPDERGKRRMSAISYMNASGNPHRIPRGVPVLSLTDDYEHCCGSDCEHSKPEDTATEPPRETDLWYEDTLPEPEQSVANPPSFLLPVMILPESLIGLQVSPGHAVVDTGAQHCVCGKPEYEALVKRLAKFGLKPSVIPTLALTAVGVGGDAGFILSAEVPTAIQGCSGVMTLNVLENPLPLLLSIEFCRKLGLVLDTEANTAHWKRLNKTSQLQELGSGHLAIDLLEFPKTGWRHPAELQEQATPLITTCKPKSYQPSSRKDFVLTEQTWLKQPHNAPQVPLPSNAGRTCSPPHRQGDRDVPRCYEWRQGRHGMPIRIRAPSPLEATCHEAVVDFPCSGNGAPSQSHPYGCCAREPVRQSGQSCGRSRSPCDLPRGGRRNHGKTATSRHREGSRERKTGPSSLRAPQRSGDPPGQQRTQVVDLQELRDPVGAQGPDGSRAPGPDERPGPGDLREVHGSDLPSCSERPVLLRADPQDHRDGNGSQPSHEASSTVLGAQGTGDRSNRRRHAVNRLFYGNQLCQMLALPLLVGYVAQVVSAGATYRSLEGPLLGTRVGIYESDTIESGWHKIINTNVSQVTESTVCTVLSDASLAVPPRIPSGKAGDEQERPYRMILYKTPEGAQEQGETQFDHEVGTLPGKVRKVLQQKLLPKAEKTSLYPLDTVPEEEELVEIPPDPEKPDPDDDLGLNEEARAKRRRIALDAVKNELPDERIENDDNAEPSSDEEEEPGARHPNFEPSAAQLRDLKIAHDNAGHPNNADFARMIKLGNGKKEIVQWVRKNFKCEECEAHKRPKARRPAAVPKSYRFNHVIGIDLIEIKGLRGNKEYWCNIHCWGTSYQQVKILEGDGAHKTAEATWNTFVDTWVRIFGFPEILVCDPGKEFEGYFGEMCAAHGVAQLPTDARAPWQNGRTERAGAEWKKQFKLAVRRATPTNDSEWRMLGDLCCQARNRYFNRSGFSPMQRVFGVSHRLPGTLLSDDPIDPQLLADNSLTDYRRSEELRIAATRSWAALDNRSRMLKVLRARHRTPQNFTDGQLVFVWRQGRVGAGRWFGPGVIVLNTQGGAWINMRGSLWRVSHEQMRSATQEESRGAELVNRYLHDMRDDFRSNRGARKYIDVTREGPPRFPDENAHMPDDELLLSDHSEGDADSEPEREEPQAPPPAPDTPSSRPSEEPQHEPSAAPSTENSRRPSESPVEVAAQDSLRPTAGDRERSRSPVNTPRAESSRTNPFPYPFDRTTSMNMYVESPDEVYSEDPKGFLIDEAVAFFEEETGIFFIKKKPEGAEVSVSKLSPKAQKLFTAAGGSREKEWKSITAPGVDGPPVRVHRGARARELKRKYADRIIPSRWHEKWKDMGDEFDNQLSDPSVAKHLGAKSRWILQGFHDPDIALLNRSVPTPETGDVPLSLQMLASIGADAWVGDVKSAFTQGLRQQRDQPLFATPPPGGIPGEDDEDILIEILTEVYGLISGPPGWRKSLLTIFKELGFKRHPLAPCVVLFYEDLGKIHEALSGLVVIETDDLLGGSIGPKMDAAVAELKRRLNFGKWVKLKDQATEYGGRTLKQNHDGSFTVSMTRYLRDKAQEISLARGRTKDLNSEATEREITQMRGVIGKLNWATREGMPQGAGDASILAGTLPKPKVKDLQEANAALRRLIQNDTPIQIKAIPLERLRLLDFGDASLGNAGEGRSQIAHMICGVDKCIHEGKEADISVLTYKSHRNPKAGASTLLVEAQALSESLADAEWVASWIGLAKDLQYDLRKRNLLNREIQITSIMSEPKSDLDLALVTDAKSLYDNLTQEQYTGAEKRAALEICVCRDSLHSLGGKARWVPHHENPVDCLTKVKGNAQRLLQMLKAGTFKLTDEEAELAQRKEYREATGKKVPRPKVTTDDPRATKEKRLYTTHSVSAQDSSRVHCGFVYSTPMYKDISSCSSCSSSFEVDENPESPRMAPKQYPFPAPMGWNQGIEEKTTVEAGVPTYANAVPCGRWRPKPRAKAPDTSEPEPAPQNTSWWNKGSVKMSMAELIAKGPPPYAPVTSSAQVSQRDTLTGAGSSTDQVKKSPSEPDSEGEADYGVAEEMDPETHAETVSETKFKLPDKPSDSLPLVPLLMSTGEREFCRIRYDSLAKDYEAIEKQIAIMELHGGLERFPQHEVVERWRVQARQTKITRHQELCILQRDSYRALKELSEKLERHTLAERNLTIETNEDGEKLHEKTLEAQQREKAAREKSPEGKHRVTQEVYDILNYQAHRQVQRQRAQQEASGTFHMATRRQWQRRVKSIRRLKIYNYVKTKEKYMQRRLADPPEQVLNLHPTALSEGMDTLSDREKAEQDWWLRTTEDILKGDINEIVQGKPPEGSIKEPAREKRTAEARKRKRANKKKRKLEAAAVAAEAEDEDETPVAESAQVSQQKQPPVDESEGSAKEEPQDEVKQEASGSMKHPAIEVPKDEFPELAASLGYGKTQPLEAFEGSEEERFQAVSMTTGFPAITVDLDDIEHWSKGYCNTKRNKHLFHPIWELYEKLSSTQKQMYDQPPSPETAVQILLAMGITREELVGQAHLADDAFETAGKLIQVDLSGIKCAANLPEIGEDSDIKLAWHATASSNIPLIVRFGLQMGPSATDGRHGVYCEGQARRHLTLHYGCHINFPQISPGTVWNVTFECLVDRNKGGTVNAQWVQERGSIWPQSMLLHGIHINDLYKCSATLGNIRVSSKTIESMRRNLSELP